MDDRLVDAKIPQSTVGDAIIVDDDAGIREVCKVYLENMGCFRNIIQAGDGVSGATKINNQNFCLILLDLNMPKKDGLKVLRQLKEQRNDEGIKSVIIISGALEKDIIAEAIKIGVKHFLVKPFDEAAFKEKVALAINRSKKK